MSAPVTPQTALLAALKAIVAECMDYPTEPRYSTESYIPQHLLESAKRAIELVEKSDAKRFATLQAQFALHGHVLHQSGPGDGPGPVSFMSERWGMARHLRTLEDADRFLVEVGGVDHE